MSDNPQFDFIHKESYSQRCISPEWINTRAAALGGGDDAIHQAITEAFDQLMVRIGDNRDYDRDPIVYPPDNVGDPYVMLIPIKNVTKKAKTETPARLHVANPDNRRSSVREEFEILIFEIEPALNKEDLARDADGNYINQRVQDKWVGFFLYHFKLTQTKSATFKDIHNNILGRYVIGKVGKNGVALFNRAPYRHLTLKDATTEAVRLVAETKEAFGIFRCLDVFGTPVEEYDR